MAKKKTASITSQQLDSLIYTVRGVRVMLDRDLAAIYGVATRVFNQAVKRNKARFPEDFMFQLTREEAESILRSRSQNVISSTKGRDLKSQTVISSSARGGRRYLPYVFTEYGALMAANILNSA
ncbi:MAG TPA: ORF6N domain-containing protein, partial [Chthoniobacterales bacterium]|nr:ORF6N domain-containing protein [Chthoniobacterales bacterium]